MARVSLRDSQQKEKDHDLDAPHRTDAQDPSNGSAHSISSVQEASKENEATERKEPGHSDGPLPRSAGEETEVVEPEHDSIQLLAYFLWQERGETHGSPENDWFRARNELQARLQQQR
jgi:hypothetical protein